MTTLSASVFVAQAAATFYLTGLIWVVQAVHYPLFASADRSQFGAFVQAHGRAITPIVGPVMLLELVTAAWWVVERPPSVPWAWAAAGAGLVVVIWLSTIGLQVPLHNTLARGFNAEAHASLVATNWLRTVSWTLRSALLAVLLLRALQSGR
ncbi:MAG TPA: hypothetical protein VMF13_11670 [Luteitalea sp.]|nr:hypothetical protein [Luteitalea sp.]